MTRADLDQDDVLAARYQTFLDHNVRQPTSPLPAGDPSPARETMTLADIHRQGGPAATETHGALLAPQFRRRFGPDVASPAPFVSTSPASAFPYRAAGSGKLTVPGPRKAVK